MPQSTPCPFQPVKITVEEPPSDREGDGPPLSAQHRQYARKLGANVKILQNPVSVLVVATLRRAAPVTPLARAIMRIFSRMEFKC